MGIVVGEALLGLPPEEVALEPVELVCALRRPLAQPRVLAGEGVV